MNPLPDLPRNALKTGWRMLVDRLGGVDAAAAACGAGRSLVSDYGNRHSDRFPPVHVVLAAERVAGDPLVTAALARAQGLELCPVDMPAGTLLAEEMARISESFGALFADWSRAMAHGAPAQADRDALDRDLHHARRMLGLAIAALATVPVRAAPDSGPAATTAAKPDRGRHAARRRQPACP